MRLIALAAAACCLVAFDAGAQFAAFVAPARFELKAKPGERLQEVLEIGNDDVTEAELRVRTSDWTLRRDGGVDFQPDTLAPDSCRPWVRIERFTVRIGGKARRKFRFQVEVPPDAGDRLCRFALLIEPSNTALNVSPLGNIVMPIQGRIGVIVYVRIGDAKPRLELERFAMETVNGRPTPVAFVRNSGTAHARPEGILRGTDGAGKDIDFVIAPLPVLPGETRMVPAWAQDGGDPKKAPQPVPPLRLKGSIEWEGGKIPVDAVIR